MNKKATKAAEPEFTTLEPEPFQITPPGSRIGLGVYLVTESAALPEYKTDGAGCFDLSADLDRTRGYLKFWDPLMNREDQRRVREDSTGRFILIEPGERILIPTGLIFSIPFGFAIHVYIRSSVGLKKGLSMANGVGYIDSDYRDEVMLPLFNSTRAQIRVDHLERLAQGALAPICRTPLVQLDERPKAVGNRKGGFGSTNK